MNTIQLVKTALFTSSLAFTAGRIHGPGERGTGNPQGWRRYVQPHKGESMNNSVLIENLGRLAAKAELDAARASEQYERIHLDDLANRYREAQYVELRKAYGQEEAA